MSIYFGSSTFHLLNYKKAAQPAGRHIDSQGITIPDPTDSTDLQAAKNLIGQETVQTIYTRGTNCSIKWTGDDGIEINCGENGKQQELTIFKKMGNLLGLDHWPS